MDIPIADFFLCDQYYNHFTSLIAGNDRNSITFLESKVFDLVKIVCVDLEAYEKPWREIFRFVFLLPLANSIVNDRIGIAESYRTQIARALRKSYGGYHTMQCKCSSI